MSRRTPAMHAASTAAWQEHANVAETWGVRRTKRAMVVSLTLSLERISFRASTFSFLGTLGSARNWANTLLPFARAWICENNRHRMSLSVPLVQNTGCFVSLIAAG